MEKWEAIYNTLGALTDEEVVDCYNEYAEANKYEQVYPMYMFEDLYSSEGRTIFEIKNDLEDVNEGDTWVYCHDVYGRRSFDMWADNSPIDLTELTNYSLGHDDDLGNSSLREILDCQIVDECLDDYEQDEFITIDGEEMTVKEWRQSTQKTLSQLVDYVDERYNSVEFYLK